eukprot:GEMP01003969.1.p1 GENE.GEMP01003969.1~~GEMP01003969.1.p1  ORF type:complete len:1236 (+),score=337.17 GEMP01003969.1:295-3708(+)
MPSCTKVTTAQPPALSPQSADVHTQGSAAITPFPPCHAQHHDSSFPQNTNTTTTLCRTATGDPKIPLVKENAPAPAALNAVQNKGATDPPQQKAPLQKTALQQQRPNRSASLQHLPTPVRRRTTFCAKPTGARTDHVGHPTNTPSLSRAPTAPIRTDAPIMDVTVLRRPSTRNDHAMPDKRKVLTRTYGSTCPQPAHFQCSDGSIAVTSLNPERITRSESQELIQLNLALSKAKWAMLREEKRAQEESRTQEERELLVWRQKQRDEMQHCEREAKRQRGADERDRRQSEVAFLREYHKQLDDARKTPFDTKMETLGLTSGQLWKMELTKIEAAERRSQPEKLAASVVLGPDGTIRRREEEQQQQEHHVRDAAHGTMLRQESIEENNALNTAIGKQSYVEEETRRVPMMPAPQNQGGTNIHDARSRMGTGMSSHVTTPQNLCSFKQLYLHRFPPSDVRASDQPAPALGCCKINLRSAQEENEVHTAKLRGMVVKQKRAFAAPGARRGRKTKHADCEAVVDETKRAHGEMVVDETKRADGERVVDETKRADCVAVVEETKRADGEKVVGERTPREARSASAVSATGDSVEQCVGINHDMRPRTGMLAEHSRIGEERRLEWMQSAKEVQCGGTMEIRDYEVLIDGSQVEAPVAAHAQFETLVGDALEWRAGEECTRSANVIIGEIAAARSEVDGVPSGVGSRVDDRFRIDHTRHEEYDSTDGDTAGVSDTRETSSACDPEQFRMILAEGSEETAVIACVAEVGEEDTMIACVAEKSEEDAVIACIAEGSEEDAACASVAEGADEDATRALVAEWTEKTAMIACVAEEATMIACVAELGEEAAGTACIAEGDEGDAVIACVVEGVEEDAVRALDTDWTEEAAVIACVAEESEEATMITSVVEGGEEAAVTACIGEGDEGDAVRACVVQGGEEDVLRAFIAEGSGVDPEHVSVAEACEEDVACVCIAEVDDEDAVRASIVEACDEDAMRASITEAREEDAVRVRVAKGINVDAARAVRGALELSLNSNSDGSRKENKCSRGLKPMMKAREDDEKHDEEGERPDSAFNSSAIVDHDFVVVPSQMDEECCAFVAQQIQEDSLREGDTSADNGMNDSGEGGEDARRQSSYDTDSLMVLCNFLREK